VSREELQRAHQAVVQSLGWRELEGWGTVHVTGNDRASFLHNMCTNDVRGLAPGEGCEAFFTDVKGKIVAHAFLFVGEHAIELLLVPGVAARLIVHLDRYIIREDVQLRDLSADYSWMMVVGRESLPALAALASPTLRPLDKPWSHSEASLNPLLHNGCRIVRCNLLWPGGALVRVGREILGENLFSPRILGVQAVELMEDLWHAIRIESAWPLFRVDFDDTNLPQEVNRDLLAIHFRKGCYLGQETVARIDALGQVNKKLVQVRFSGDDLPEFGSSLASGSQEAGRVTSLAWSPKLQSPLALAMVRRQFNSPGTTLQANEVSAEVLPIAAVDTAGA
jgi:folate-binding protein YgfZ